MAEQQQPQSGDSYRQALLKWSVHHYKLPHVDDRAFAKWYTEVQVPQIMKIAKRHGILKYSLYITPSYLRDYFEAEIKEIKTAPGWKLAPFDVTAAYWADSPEKLKAMLADPDWENIIIAGEKPWIDTERADCQIGWDNTYLEDGKIINV
ncbi:hypothetical protein DL763_000502 [Monosporascus cannonballus]|nr:hypothetical protein DL763_000502 [Monosporascus cannonballus]